MTDLARIGFAADTSGLTKAQRELGNLANKGEQTERKLDRSIKNTNQSFMSLKSSVGLVGTALAALGSARLTQDLVKYSDTWKGVNSQIRQVTGSEKELLAVRQMVVNTAKETRSDLEATTKLYTALDRATTHLGVSTEKQIELTKTINNLFLSGGKSAEEASGAIRQLTQGLESGALRGDEFNSVAENAPRILDALAESLGMARGELREFAATGGITAEILVKALGDYNDEAQKLADQTEKTFGQNMEIATTNLTAFVGELDGVNSIIGSVGGGIVELSGNMDALSDAIEIGATVLAVGASPALIAYSASLFNAAKAQLLAGTTATKTVNAFGQVTTSAAAATVATNALGVATRFLLGPWGLVISAVGIAAATYYSAKDAVVELDSAQKNLNKTLEDSETILGRFQKAQDALLLSGLKLADMSKNRLQEEFDKASKKLELYQSRLDRLKDNKASQSRIEQLTQKIREQEVVLDAITKKLPSASTTYDKLTGSILKLADRLDPLTAAQNKLVKEQKILSDAQEKGIITGIEYSTMLALLNNEFDKNWNSAEKLLTPFEKMSLELEDQRKQLVMTADEYEIYRYRLDAIANGVDSKMIPALIKAAKANQNLRKELNDSKDFDLNLDKLIDQADNFGGVWSKTGNIIADSFGDAAAQLDDFASKMQKITGLQNELNAARSEAVKKGKSTTEIDSALAKLNEESLNTQIGAVGQLAGVTSKMFKENSKERKALHAIEMAFAAAEIAIATEKAIVNAVNAVATQGQGDPYSAFARIAAMTAIMGGVLAAAGIAFSGGGGGGSAPKNTGTGTVLGSDEASGSISNSAGIFEDIALDQLAELRGIRDSLNNVASGISMVTRDLVASRGLGQFNGTLSEGNNLSSGAAKAINTPLQVLLGDFGGLVSKFTDSLFGSVKRKIVDSGIQFVSQSLAEIMEQGTVQASQFFDIEKTKKKFFGLSEKTSTSTEFQELDSSFGVGIGAVFKSIGNAVLQSAELLGFETVSILQSTLVRSVDDNNFSDFGRNVASRFTQVFEMTEVSLEDALSSFKIDIGSISLEGLSGEEVEAKLQAVFSQQADLIAEFLIPAISDYQKVGEGAFETLQRVAMEQAVFNDAINSMGLGLSDLSAIMQIDVAQSIIDMIGGFDNFKDLTGEYVNAFFSEQEKFDMLASSLGEVFEQLGYPIPQTRDAFRALVESLDLTTEEGQQAFAMLMQLVPGMDAYLKELEKQGDIVASLEDSLSAAYDEIKKAVDAEKILASARMESSIAAAQAEIDALSLRRAALDSQKQLLDDNLSFAESELRKTFNAEKELARERSSVAISAINNEINALSIQKASLSEQKSLLTSNLSFAESELKKTFNAEKELARQRSDIAISAINDQINALNMQKSALDEQNSLLINNLSLAESQLRASFDAEKQAIQDSLNEKLDALSKERELINSASNERISALNDEKSIESDLSKERISALNKEKSVIERSVSGLISLADKMNSAAGSSVTVDQALIAARRGNFDVAESLNVSQVTDSGFSSAEEMVFAQARQNAQLREIGALAGSKADEQSRVVSSIESQIASQERLSAEQAAIIDEQIELENQNAEAQLAKINEQIESENQNAENQITALDAQLNALLGIDTSVMSIADSINAFQQAQIDLSGFDYASQIDALNEQIALAEEQIELEQQRLDDELTALDAQLNAILGIDTSIMSMSSAINGFQQAQIDLDNLKYDEQISALNEQIALAQEQIELEQQRLAAELTALDDQLNAILGVDTSIMSMSESIALYQQAQLDLEELNYESQITAIEEQIALAQEQIELARQAYNDEIARLDAILEDSEAQINALLGIDTSVMSVEDAVNNLSAIIANANETVDDTPPAPPAADDNLNGNLSQQNNDSTRDQEVAAAIKASTRANAETADILQKIYRGEINVRVVNP